MIRNLATSLVLYEYINTTEAKAKETKLFVENILAKSKTSDLNTRKHLLEVFFDKNAVNKIVDELIPRYSERKSGFIRSFRLENRPGDNASMMRIELVDKKVFVKEKNAEKTDTKEVKDASEKENDNK